MEIVFAAAKYALLPALSFTVAYLGSYGAIHAHHRSVGGFMAGRNLAAKVKSLSLLAVMVSCGLWAGEITGLVPRYALQLFGLDIQLSAAHALIAAGFGAYTGGWHFRHNFGGNNWFG
jgi:hypothetical protein